jgi:hypothetical protein
LNLTIRRSSEDVKEFNQVELVLLIFGGQSSDCMRHAEAAGGFSTSEPANNRPTGFS